MRDMERLLNEAYDDASSIVVSLRSGARMSAVVHQRVKPNEHVVTLTDRDRPDVLAHVRIAAIDTVHISRGDR